VVRTKKYRQMAVVRLCQFESPNSVSFFLETYSGYGSEIFSSRSFRNRGAGDTTLQSSGVVATECPPAKT
jgi:hypothetical protein